MKQNIIETTLISDPMRTPVLAQRLEDGRILVRSPGERIMLFSIAELDRLHKFANGLGTLQCHR